MNTGIEPEREKRLERYERMTCVLCGKPLKISMADYNRKMHIKCLLEKLRKLEPAHCKLMCIY